MGTQYWQHPAEIITFLSEETKDTSTVNIYTDGSKSEKGVGAGIAIYMSGDLIKSLKYKLNNRCTNNQTEQLAILKALQHTVNIHVEDKMVTVYTDSRMTLDSLKNTNIHTALTYLLTPRCRVLLEKLTGLQLVKKFPAFHGTPRFITALTRVRHLSLSWASPIQSIYPHPTS